MMKLGKVIFQILITLLLITTAVYDVSAQQGAFDFYTPPAEKTNYPLISNENPKNVILLIGDGMGLTQVSTARIAGCGPDGKLHMERMPVTGYVKTHSLNKLVTDSAASGSAIATGVKTENGMISMTPDGLKHMSIMAAAQAKGMAAGLVVTCRITHATPAVFAAHIRARSREADIAEQIVVSNINVLFGGGRELFFPSTNQLSKRSDNLDLIAKARNMGYTFVDNKRDMLQAGGSKILGLFQDGPLTTLDPEPSLSEMTVKAIELLKRNSKGFFLMVEGSQIDWEAHDNESAKMIRQILLFDLSVKTALDIALRDRETLVIVTADHETGGMVIENGKLDGTLLDIAWITTHHSAAPVPLYAFGPGAEKFMGVHDNTDLPVIIAELLKIDNFPRIIN